ncbi:pyrroloquinoline quinone precursor peptide PqqA [Cohnella endophytica]|uniref:Coenzyme PQQ synthesis protein A n=1 Tax=Cohnella endophytica TaxID=2419778 RepID=A0A494XBI6_9BACL|nr:pyrroloquinoline quinone precursor peptide PqqA [Cohnella endophytica]
MMCMSIDCSNMLMPREVPIRDDWTPLYYLLWDKIKQRIINHDFRQLIPRQGGGTMWVKPSFTVIEVCAEVTAYAYQK